MLTINDYKTLAQRDYKLCCKVEEDFPDEYAVSAAAFHIQQAVEKLLKALMIRCGEQPECTHNIVKLTAKCTAIGIKLPKCLDDISDTLTLWGTSGRCDPFVAFSEKKYAKAKEVYSELSEKLDMVLKGMEDLSEDEDQGFQPTM